MWSFNCPLKSCRQALRTVFPYKDNIDSVLFVDVSMMLYIMYFPVYRSKEDYNNFTSAHSWLLLTLGVWNFEWINLEVGLFSVSLSADDDSLANKSKLTCKNESCIGHSKQGLTFSKLEYSLHLFCTGHTCESMV